MSGDVIAFVLIAAAPPATAAAAFLFFRRFVRGRPDTGWTSLLAGNALVLAVLLTSAFFALECYYRFVYDTTDGDAQTKVSVRWFAANWQRNSLNVRDDIEYTRIRLAPRRVTIFGDSFTAGHGVALEERFANRIRAARPEWEVHAIANLGNSTQTHLENLVELVRSGYALDVVVLVYVFNDIEPLIPDMDVVYAQFKREPPALLAPLVDHSYFANALFYYWKMWRASRSPATDYFSVVEEAYRGPLWERERELLLQFRDAVEAAGGRLLAVTFPMLVNLGRGEEEDHAMHSRLAALWAQEGVPTLDLLPILSAHKGRHLVVSRFDDHPGPRAHALAGEALLEFIESEAPPARRP